MKKHILFFLFCGILSLNITGCGQSNNPQEDSLKQELEDYVPTSEEEATHTEETETTPEEEPIVPPVVNETTLAAEITMDSKIDLQESNWNIAAFKLGNVIYSLPFSYARIQENWNFDAADYGYEDGFTLSAYCMTTPTIKLNHPVHDLKVSIGLRNPSNAEIDPSLSEVWAVTLSIADASSYPEITLPGGIGWGSSIVDVVLAYGAPEVPVTRNAETNCLEYKYNDGYDLYLTLIIDEEKGLQEVSYLKYN